MDSSDVHTYTQLLHKLRLVKSPAELNLMRKAGQIAASAFREVWLAHCGWCLTMIMFTPHSTLTPPSLLHTLTSPLLHTLTPPLTPHPHSSTLTFPSSSLASPSLLHILTPPYPHSLTSPLTPPLTSPLTPLFLPLTPPLTPPLHSSISSLLPSLPLFPHSSLIPPLTPPHPHSHHQTMHSTRPDVMEYQLESVFEHHCKMKGAQTLSFPPVVAGGSRANCLHYIANNRELR